MKYDLPKIIFFGPSWSLFYFMSNCWVKCRAFYIFCLHEIIYLIVGFSYMERSFWVCYIKHYGKWTTLCAAYF